MSGLITKDDIAPVGRLIFKRIFQVIKVEDILRLTSTK